MKRLRHRLGRWLLRDAHTVVRLVPDVTGWAEKLQRQMRSS